MTTDIKRPIRWAIVITLIDDTVKCVGVFKSHDRAIEMAPAIVKLFGVVMKWEVVEMIVF